MLMHHVLLAGVGGFVGTVARFMLGGWILHLAPQAKFPFGTFVINLAGCLVIGALAGLTEKHALLGPSARVFLFTGLLGGFTTFSAFGLETLGLLRRGEPWLAMAYVAGSVLLGVLLVWLGFRGVQLLPSRPS